MIYGTPRLLTLKRRVAVGILKPGRELPCRLIIDIGRFADSMWIRDAHYEAYRKGWRIFTGQNEYADLRNRVRDGTRRRRRATAKQRVPGYEAGLKNRSGGENEMQIRTQEELRAQLRRIDHKGYKAYKDLEGAYDFGGYWLAIDHVQGDPFAAPSRVRILYPNRGNIAPQYFDSIHRKTATEDYLLRRLRKSLRAGAGAQHETRPGNGGQAWRAESGNGRNEIWKQYTSRGRRDGYEARGDGFEEPQEKSGYENDHSGRPGRAAGGSGKSGLVTTCGVGQEILERTAMHISQEVIEARIEVGFPAYGRTIAAGELGKILFDFLPDVTERTFRMQKQMQRELDEVVKLADDQQYIREALPREGLVAFVADGSILPRESGISQKPMKQAVVFRSPDSLAVTLDLPHRGKVRGMGVRQGITVIAGGGFHGKSTLLKALERGVYNHIAGDGRELVITEQSACKLRAEEGRCIHETDISMFIDHLPTKTDTRRFSTENASGSTSQAANTVEALACGSRVLLIDEDTSATNFMVRDGRMARLVSDEKEPITPFIRKIRSLYRDLGVSTVLVVGSSGDYLSVADVVLQMDCYEAKDVTARARELCGPLIEEKVKLPSGAGWNPAVCGKPGAGNNPVVWGNSGADNNPAVCGKPGTGNNSAVCGKPRTDGNLTACEKSGAGGDLVTPGQKGAAQTHSAPEENYARNPVKVQSSSAGNNIHSTVQAQSSLAGNNIHFTVQAQSSLAGNTMQAPAIVPGNFWLKKKVRPGSIEKARVHGWDSLSLDRTEIDLRYLEQIVDESQTAALAYLMQYILGRMADGKKTISELADEAARKIEKDGILSVTPKNYGAGAAAFVRRQEILACLARYRNL